MQYTSKGLRLPDKTDSFTIDDANFNMNKLNTITDSAPKLSTARKISLDGDATGEVYFDGQQNVTIPVVIKKIAKVGSDEVASNGWYKVASGTPPSTMDANYLFSANTGLINRRTGLFEFGVRNDNGTLTVKNLVWLTRRGHSLGDVCVTVSGTTWTLYFYQGDTRYGRVYLEVLRANNTAGDSIGITLYNSTTKEATPPVGTTSVDGHTVNSANKLTTPRLINGVAFDGTADIDLGQIRQLVAGTSVISYVNSLTVLGSQSGLLNQTVRILNGSDVPSGYSTSDSDFVFDIYKVESAWWKVFAHDVRSGKTFTLFRLSSGTPIWQEIATTNSTVARAICDKNGKDITTYDGGGATYEEGTWTPIIYNGASIITSTFDNTQMPARYYKVGKLVFIEYTSFINSGTPVSVSLIHNLPFVTRNSFNVEETLKINDITPYLNGSSDAIVNLNNITKITVQGYYKLA